MFHILNHILTGILAPAKIINSSCEDIEEKQIISKGITAVITLWIFMVGFKDGSFRGENAIINIMAMIVITFLIRKISRIAEKVISFLLQNLTFIPSGIYDLCKKIG